MFTSLLLLQTFLACVIQFAGIGSAVLYFISGSFLFLSLLLNALFTNGGEIALWTYALAQFVPILTGTQLMAATLDVFVPLVSVVVLFGYIHIHEFVIHRQDALAPKRRPSTLLPA
jgi:hypothetical protein